MQGVRLTMARSKVKEKVQRNSWLAAGSGARCRVARGCPRGPEPSASTGWWLDGASARWDLCGLVLVRMQIDSDASLACEVLQIKRCGDEDDG